MARPTNLDTLAISLLSGSCLNTLEVSRTVGGKYERVVVARDVGRAKVLSFTKTLIVEAPVERAMVLPTGPDMSNDMPFIGYINTTDDVVRYYGTPAGYEKLKAQ